MKPVVYFPLLGVVGTLASFSIYNRFFISKPLANFSSDVFAGLMIGILLGGAVLGILLEKFSKKNLRMRPLFYWPLIGAFVANFFGERGGGVPITAFWLMTTLIIGFYMERVAKKKKDAH